MMDVDGRFFITGTPGRRDWLANLRANPRRSVIEHLAATWYRGQTSVDDLVTNAPMVEIAFS